MLRQQLPIFLAAALLALPSRGAADPLDGLDFLIGSWRGGPSGAAGSDVFRRDLNGSVIKRRSQGGARNPAGRDRSMAELTIYPTGNADALAAIYFDNEGHVIHYARVIVTPGQRVEFSSDGPGPRFRLTYSLQAAGLLHVRFEMAPPGESPYHIIAEADETVTHQSIK